MILPSCTWDVGVQIVVDEAVNRLLTGKANVS